MGNGDVCARVALVLAVLFTNSGLSGPLLGRAVEDVVVGSMKLRRAVSIANRSWPSYHLFSWAGSPGLSVVCCQKLGASPLACFLSDHSSYSHRGAQNCW